MPNATPQQPADDEVDNVNHPPHYNKGGIEIIEMCDQICADYPGDQAGCVFQVIKYTARAPHKGNKVEDLKKGRWYLDHLIELAEKADADTRTEGNTAGANNN